MFVVCDFLKPDGTDVVLGSRVTGSTLLVSDSNITMSDVDQLTFVSLPVVLSVEILCRWLDLRSLVRLDSAACSHKIRLTLHGLLSSNHCVFASALTMEDFLVVGWFRARKLQVCIVMLSISFPELTRYFRSHAGSIRHMRCTASETVGVVAIYAHNLETFWYENSTAVPELSDILWMNSNLKELRLDGLGDLKSEHFCELSLPHLRLLSLWNTPCSDEMLGKIIHTTETLQKIDIGGCAEVTDAGVIAVAQCCPLLSSLGFSALPISDEALLQVTQLCPCIESLDLSENDAVTDLGVLAISKSLHNLRRLSISICPSLTDVSMEHLIKHSALTLQELRATGLPSLRVDVLLTLIQQCSHLHTLSLDCDLDAYSTEIVPHMHNLRALVTNCQISDATLCLIAQHCQNLEKLAIFSDHMCVEPSQTDLAPVPGLPGDGHVMHRAANDLPWEDLLYTEKGLLALMDGLPQLRVLGVQQAEIQLGLLTPFAQSMWRRVRPHIAFGGYNSFIFNVLLE